MPYTIKTSSYTHPLIFRHEQQRIIFDGSPGGFGPPGVSLQATPGSGHRRLGITTAESWGCLIMGQVGSTSCSFRCERSKVRYITISRLKGNPSNRLPNKDTEHLRKNRWPTPIGWLRSSLWNHHMPDTLISLAGLTSRVDSPAVGSMVGWFVQCGGCEVISVGYLL